jgi:uncharacterized membrane protein YfcA
VRELLLDLILGLILGAVVGTSLGIIGAGGAILAVPGLVAVLGLDAKIATTASTIIVGSAAAAGFIQRIKSKALDFRIGLTFSAIGIGGTFIGTFLLRFTPDTYILVLFSILMFGAAFAMWRKGSPVPKSAKPNWVLIFLSATGVGIATGLLGIGGGFLIVPALVLFLNVPTKTATGTSLVAITLNSVITFGLRFQYWDEMPWLPVLTFASSAVVASFVTARFSQKFKPEFLQKGFALLITVVATYMLLTRFI